MYIMEHLAIVLLKMVMGALQMALPSTSIITFHLNHNRGSHPAKHAP